MHYTMPLKNTLLKMAIGAAVALCLLFQPLVQAVCWATEAKGSLDKQRIFQDAFGHRVVLETAPKRVISLAPNITETLFALGVESTLVGVTSFCNYPPAAQKLERIGGILDFDLEKIAALKPDLVIAVASGSTKRRVEQLNQVVGGKLLAYRVDTLDQFYALVTDLGAIFKVDQQAEQLQTEMVGRIEKVRRTGAKLPNRRVAFMVGCSPDIAAGRDGFLNEWLQLAGAANVYDGVTGYTNVNLERLTQLNPQTVLIAAGGDGKACDRFREAAAKLLPQTAIKSLESDLFQRLGPRAPQAIETLFELLHRTVQGKRKRG